jgi:hypothetical protein
MTHLLKEKSADSSTISDSPTASSNGLFCCLNCDKLFEAHKINIDGDGTARFAPGVASKELFENHPHYKGLDGRKTPWADKIGSNVKFPPAELLEWRKTLPVAKRRSKKSLFEEFGLPDDEDVQAYQKGDLTECEGSDDEGEKMEEVDEEGGDKGKKKKMKLDATLLRPLSIHEKVIFSIFVEAIKMGFLPWWE